MSYTGFRFTGNGAVLERPADRAAATEGDTWARDKAADAGGTEIDATFLNRLKANLENFVAACGGDISDGDDQLANAILAALSTRSATDHNHDERYYQKALVEPLTAKGAANGYASLDVDGKVPVAQMPASVVGALAYQGSWNASTNTPSLASGTGTQGFYYVVGTAGSTALDGITDWKVGDWAVYNGTAWEKIDNTDAVSSVAGKTGAVTLDKSDVGLGKFWTKGDDVASASTIDLDAATGDFVVITGTTAITGITLATGQRRRLRFAASLTLTHGASFVLPASANIVTEAGDLADVIGDASGVVRVTGYIRASGATNLVPGDLVLWMSNTARPGTLSCDGSAVSRTTYAALFASIGTRFGSGDGSTTFNLPDFRGEFLRGWANGSSNDPDRASRTNRGDGTTGDNVGTKQADQLKAHTHGISDHTQVESAVSGTRYRASPAETMQSGSTGGNETRPRNVAVNICIAY